MWPGRTRIPWSARKQYSGWDSRKTRVDFSSWKRSSSELNLTDNRFFMALSHVLHQHVQRWNKEEIERCGQDHAAEYRSADRLPARTSCAAGGDQRQNAKNECQRCHQDGAQTDTRGLDGCFNDGHPPSAQLLREFNDK